MKMSEHPVRLKGPRPKTVGGRRRSSVEKICIVHFKQNKKDTVLRTVSDSAFQTIKASASLRQCSNDEHTRLDDICRCIPDSIDGNIHGMHRWCYQTFTNVARIRKKSAKKRLYDKKRRQPPPNV